MFLAKSKVNGTFMHVKRPVHIRSGMIFIGHIVKTKFKLKIFSIFINNTICGLTFNAFVKVLCELGFI